MRGERVITGGVRESVEISRGSRSFALISTVAIPPTVVCLTHQARKTRFWVIWIWTADIARHVKTPPTPSPSANDVFLRRTSWSHLSSRPRVFEHHPSAATRGGGGRMVIWFSLSCRKIEAIQRSTGGATVPDQQPRPKNTAYVFSPAFI